LAGSTTNYGATKPAPGEAYDVNIVNNNSDIWDAQIKAEAHKVQHVEFVRQGHVAGTGIIGPGDLSTLIDATNSKNYTDWATAATDQVTIGQEGMYAASWKIVPNVTVTIWHSIDTGGSAAAATLGRTQASSVAASDAFWAYANPFYVPPAGVVVLFKFSLSAGQTINHRIRLTKLK
jgi:hypothetical protein